MIKQRASLAVAIVAVALSVLPGRALDAATPLDGLWDAVVVAGETEVPFRFEIASKGADVEGSFFEGDRKIGSSSGTLVDGGVGKWGGFRSGSGSECEQRAEDRAPGENRAFHDSSYQDEGIDRRSKRRRVYA